MAEPVEIAFRRAALPLLDEGDAVLIAVSGGGDSMALLHLSARLAVRLNLRLTVAHLDHALRRGSAADRRFVERAAHSLGLPCIAERRSVSALRRRDESPEEAARRVRREFLLQAADATDSRQIALGHTLDDQAETVLLRLARGGGPRSLTGMGVSGPGPFIRPLLDVERAALRDYLRRHHLAFLEDPSNRDLRFDRNRVRLRVLPVLQEWLNPRVARHLVDAVARFREDAVWLDEDARRRFDRLAKTRRGGRVELSASGLARLPRALALRVSRVALEAAGADRRRIGSRHLDAILSLAAQGDGRALDLADGVLAKREGKGIILHPAPGRMGRLPDLVE